MAVKRLKRKQYGVQQRGFSLFEMLLTVGVAATFFIFLFNIGQTIARDQAIRASASYVQSIDEAVNVMLSDPARFDVLYNNVVASGGVAQVSIDALKGNPSGVLNGLPNNPILNSAFPAIGPFRQTYSVIFRTPPVVGTARVIESYVASQTLLEDTLVTRIAGAIGGTGGALRDQSTVAGVNNIRGAYGGWVASTNNILISSWYTTIAGQSAPTLQNGGYIVSYNYYDVSRIAKDYLYRNNTGVPAHNTMYTDLSMGSYNVLGADTVSGTGALTSSELIVEGTTTFANAPSIAGSLQSDGPLALGSIGAAGGAGIQMSAAGSDVVVNNNTNATRAVFNNAFTTDSHTANALTTQDTTINSGNFNASNTNGINASAASGGLIVSGNVNVTNQVQSSAITTNNLTANNGLVATIGASISGDVAQNSGTTVSNEYGSQSLTRSTTSDFPCGIGCGE